MATATDLADQLVGLAEIADRAATTAGTVRSWRNRHAGTFPAPLVTLAVGPVWWWPDVLEWLKLERRNGRPKVAREVDGTPAPIA